MLPVLPLILLGGGAVAAIALSSGGDSKPGSAATNRLFLEMQRAANDALAGTPAQRKAYAAVGMAMILEESKMSPDALWKQNVKELGGEQKAAEEAYLATFAMVPTIDGMRTMTAAKIHGNPNKAVTFRQVISTFQAINAAAGKKTPADYPAKLERQARRFDPTFSLDIVVPPMKEAWTVSPSGLNVGSCGCGPRRYGCVSRYLGC